MEPRESDEVGDDWLQLTDEDIERAHQYARTKPSTPEVLIIRPSDISAEPLSIAAPSRLIKITSADLAPSLPGEQDSVTLNGLERYMFNLVNQARQEHLPRWVGTSNLIWHDQLAAVARGHSNDMLRRQYVAHISPEGITAAQRISRHGISYVACGENIGIFYGPIAGDRIAVIEIHEAFMNQPKSMTNHRGNLLNPVWTHIGIGLAYNPDGSLVATQNFVSAPARRIKGQ